jgi:hypothetical protein
MTAKFRSVAYSFSSIILSFSTREIAGGCARGASSPVKPFALNQTRRGNFHPLSVVDKKF